MTSNVFLWLLSQPVTVYVVSVPALIMSSIVSVLIILRKWGGYQ